MPASGLASAVSAFLSAWCLCLRVLHSDALGDDVNHAVAKLRAQGTARVLALQSAGTVFCAGGNPFASRGAGSLAAFVQGLRASFEGYVDLATLQVPVVWMLSLGHAPEPSRENGGILCRWIGTVVPTAQKARIARAFANLKLFNRCGAPEAQPQRAT